ncbi:Rrf2 family transcriptional regulator [Nocardia sp. NPDC051833]|uniref:RrF2 family transcriptional regulator n=1 Tax=Nocardia sp. NPDC051833 TaxID=3155674 RepID=UPI0034292BF4
MQLTASTDIGMRAVMRLAAADQLGDRVTIKAIAHQVGASERTVSTVVARLVEIGVIATSRGRGGGLMLTGTARSTRLGTLIRQLEQRPEVVDCAGPPSCPMIAGCRLRHALAQATEAFYRELDRFTVADLVAGAAGQLLPLRAHPPQRSPADAEEFPR